MSGIIVIKDKCLQYTFLPKNKDLKMEEIFYDHRYLLNYVVYYNKNILQRFFLSFSTEICQFH